MNLRYPLMYSFCLSKFMFCNRNLKVLTGKIFPSLPKTINCGRMTGTMMM